MSESYLISVAIKSTIVLLAGLIACELMRGRNAAVRHMICLSALASAVIAPLLALWSPQWSVLISVPAEAGLAGGDSGGAGVWNWSLIFASIWVLGALVMACRSAAGWFVLAMARRRSEQFQERDGIDVRIGDVSTPLACGVLHPMILLPANACTWDEERLRAVLLHESGHIRRRDCVTAYVAIVARALLWWNPLVWILAARQNREQELACDAEVLAAGVSADAYAGVLIDLVRECPRPTIFGCAMAGGAALRERFQHLFEWRQGATRSSGRMAIAVPLLLVLMTTVSFAEKIYKIGPGIVPPKVIEKHNPVYPEKEKKAKIEGTVKLLVVVGTDQLVHEIKVTKSVTLGLDANAVAAVRTWKFEPGTKDGKPVAVRATIEINFRLL
jgi:TonB family protein